MKTPFGLDAMSKATIGRWQIRWGVVHFTRTKWNWPGYRLTRNGKIVGVRWRDHGWILMPLHRLADRR